MPHWSPSTLQAPAADPPFLRLWTSFLAGRVLVAVALLLLQALGFAFNQHAEPVLATVCTLYLLATVMALAFSRAAPPPPQAGIRWLPTIGVDLAAIMGLQTLQSGAMNFTPLFGLPILMAGVLGTLTLALGTTAAATLMLLAWTWWLGGAGTAESTQRYFQAALTGTGYFIVAYLVHQLATRLHREQERAQEGLLAAKLQEQVSALVIDHLSDGVLVVDGGDTVRLANPAALLFLGGAPTPAPPFALGGTPSWAPLLDLARQTFQKAQPQSAGLDVLHPGQSPLALHVRTWLTASPLVAPGTGGAQLCVMFLHDLREMEARLRTEKLAAMGRMSAAVAHEIRNPLAAIVQAYALLEEDLADPAHRRLTQMVGQNADRLARIAEDVLDIARVQHQIHHAPAGVIESRLDRGGLPVVAAEKDRLDPRVLRAEGPQLRPRAVAAAVVDEDQLVLTLQLLGGGGHLPVESVDALFLVVEGDDDAEIHQGIRLMIRGPRSWVSGSGSRFQVSMSA